MDPSRLRSGPSKDMTTQNLYMWTYLENGLCGVLKSRSWDNHPGLKWALSSMTSSYKGRERDMDTEIWKERHRLEWYHHGPWNSRSHQKLGEWGKRGIFPRAFRWRMFLQYTVQNLNLQSCMRINFYCFKVQSLWYFVTGAPGNKYTEQGWILLPVHAPRPITPLW